MARGRPAEFSHPQRAKYFTNCNTNVLQASCFSVRPRTVYFAIIIIIFPPSTSTILHCWPGLVTRHLPHSPPLLGGRPTYPVRSEIHLPHTKSLTLPHTKSLTLPPSHSLTLPPSHSLTCHMSHCLTVETGDQTSFTLSLNCQT